MSLPTSLKVVKKKYYLCALPAKLRPNQYTVTENSDATGYLMTKEGKKTRNIDEALCLELETAVGEAWLGRDWAYFAPSATVLIKGMICQIEDEEHAMQFLRLHPLPRKKISADKRAEVHAMFGGRCAYCGKEITLAEMQVDHIEAYSSGGHDGDGNLFPSCDVCNRVKSSYSLEAFRQYVRHCGEIHRKRKEPIMADADKIAIAYGIENADGEVTFFFEKWEKMAKQLLEGKL